VDQDTIKRIEGIEARLQVVEAVVEDAKAKVAAFAKGPGSKILATLGLKL
jgi:hypothetical protein